MSANILQEWDQVQADPDFQSLSKPEREHVQRGWLSDRKSSLDALPQSTRQTIIAKVRGIAMPGTGPAVDESAKANQGNAPIDQPGGTGGRGWNVKPAAGYPARTDDTPVQAAGRFAKAFGRGLGDEAINETIQGHASRAGARYAGEDALARAKKDGTIEGDARWNTGLADTSNETYDSHDGAMGLENLLHPLNLARALTEPEMLGRGVAQLTSVDNYLPVGRGLHAAEALGPVARTAAEDAIQAGGKPIVEGVKAAAKAAFTNPNAKGRFASVLTSPFAKGVPINAAATAADAALQGYAETGHVDPMAVGQAAVFGGLLGGAIEGGMPAAAAVPGGKFNRDIGADFGRVLGRAAPATVQQGPAAPAPVAPYDVNDDIAKVLQAADESVERTGAALDSAVRRGDPATATAEQAHQRASDRAAQAQIGALDETGKTPLVQMPANPLQLQGPAAVMPAPLPPGLLGKGPGVAGSAQLMPQGFRAIDDRPAHVQDAELTDRLHDVTEQLKAASVRKDFTAVDSLVRQSDALLARMKEGPKPATPDAPTDPRFALLSETHALDAKTKQVQEANRQTAEKLGLPQQAPMTPPPSYKATRPEPTPAPKPAGGSLSPIGDTPTPKPASFTAALGDHGPTLVDHYRGQQPDSIVNMARTGKVAADTSNAEVNPRLQDMAANVNKPDSALGRFEAVPQPLRMRSEPKVADVLTPDEALHRTMLSKNHQHHLAKLDAAGRERFMQNFKQRWVGEHPYHLADVPLEKLDRRPFNVDEAKVKALMANPPKDDGNHPIISRNDSASDHKHIILDGNHRVEAALRSGQKTMKAYVASDVLPDISPDTKAAAPVAKTGSGGHPKDDVTSTAHAVTKPAGKSEQDEHAISTHARVAQAVADLENRLAKMKGGTKEVSVRTQLAQAKRMLEAAEANLKKLGMEPAPAAKIETPPATVKPTGAPADLIDAWLRAKDVADALRGAGKGDLYGKPAAWFDALRKRAAGDLHYIDIINAAEKASRDFDEAARTGDSAGRGKAGRELQRLEDSARGQARVLNEGIESHKPKAPAPAKEQAPAPKAPPTPAPPTPITRPLNYVTTPAAINAKVWYHGTGTPDLTPDKLSTNATKIDGLFGHGVYLTDNPEIAQGYATTRAKRSGTLVVYAATVNVGKVLDLDKPMPADALGVFQKIASSFYEAGDEVRAALDEAAEVPGANGQSIYKAFSQAISDERVPMSEAAEPLQNLSADLRELGYDAYTHTGGARTGNDPHQVLIMLDPADELGAYLPGQPKSPTGGFTHFAPWDGKEAPTRAPTTPAPAKPDAEKTPAELRADLEEMKAAREERRREREATDPTSQEARVPATDGLEQRLAKLADQKIADGTAALKDFFKDTRTSAVPFSPEVMKALADIGAGYALRGVVKFAGWAKAVREHVRSEFGDHAVEAVEPHLDGLWDKALGEREAAVTKLLAKQDEAPGLSPATRSGDQITVSPTDLLVDAKAYQFKEGGDPTTGVTDRLRGITRWNPKTAARSIIVVHERDGKLYVVDGHQRVGLAQRLIADGHTIAPLKAVVYREQDGFDIGEMRRMGALLNLSDGTGTAIDAAKVFRGAELSPDEEAMMPRQGDSAAIIRDGKELAKLSDDAFGFVSRGTLKAQYAAVVGQMVRDPKHQLAALEELAADPPASAGEAAGIVRQIIEAGYSSGTQINLFGEVEITNSLRKPIAHIVEATKRALRQEGSGQAQALRNKVRLEARGSSINKEGSEAGVREARELEYLLEKGAYAAGTPINEAIKDAATRNLSTRAAVERALTALGEELATLKPQGTEGAPAHSIPTSGDAGLFDTPAVTPDPTPAHSGGGSALNTPSAPLKTFRVKGPGGYKDFGTIKAEDADGAVRAMMAEGGQTHESIRAKIVDLKAKLKATSSSITATALETNIANAEHLLAATAEEEGAPKAKPAKDEPAAANQSQRDYKDVGEKIGGARKDTWRAIEDGDASYSTIDWDALDAEPGQAAKVITRANLLAHSTPQHLRDAGMPSNVAYLAHHILQTIAVKPATDTTLARRVYAKATERVQRAMMQARTIEDIGQVVKDLREEQRGFHMDAAERVEYDRLNAAVTDARKPYREADERVTALYKAWQAAELAANEVRYNRRLKDEAKRTALLAPLLAEVERKRKPWSDALAAKKPLEATRDAAYQAYSDNHRTLEARDRANPESWHNAIGMLGDRFSAMLKGKGAVWEKHGPEAKRGIQDGDWSWSEKETTATGEKAPKAEKTHGLPEWERYVPDSIERTGGKAVGATKPEQLQSDFNLRAVEYGNYVTQDEAAHHTRRAAEALSDLADALGIDKHDVSYGGRLALAIGARGNGNALAHYESVKKVINITKGSGGGSVAHEWGHFFDNILAQVSYGETGGHTSFASKDVHGPQMPPDVTAAFAELNRAIRVGDVEATAIVKPGKTRYRPMSLLDKMIAQHPGDGQAAFDALRRGDHHGNGPAGGLKAGRLAKDWAKYIAATTGQDIKYPVGGPGLSTFLATAMDMGKYWERPHELFARAWESYVQDKLQDKGIRNSYLVSGTNEDTHWREKGSKKASSFAYPQGEERARTNAAFDKLVAAVKESGMLKLGAGAANLLDHVERAGHEKIAKARKSSTLGTAGGAGGDLVLGHAMVLAARLARSGVERALKFHDWAKEMRQEHGPAIVEHLKAIWEKAQELADKVMPSESSMDFLAKLVHDYERDPESHIDALMHSRPAEFTRRIESNPAWRGEKSPGKAWYGTRETDRTAQTAEDWHEQHELASTDLHVVPKSGDYAEVNHYRQRVMDNFRENKYRPYEAARRNDPLAASNKKVSAALDRYDELIGEGHSPRDAWTVATGFLNEREAKNPTLRMPESLTADETAPRAEAMEAFMREPVAAGGGSSFASKAREVLANEDGFWDPNGMLEAIREKLGHKRAATVPVANIATPKPGSPRKFTSEVEVAKALPALERKIAALKAGLEKNVATLDPQHIQRIEAKLAELRAQMEEMHQSVSLTRGTATEVAAKLAPELHQPGPRRDGEDPVIAPAPVYDGAKHEGNLNLNRILDLTDPHAEDIKAVLQTLYAETQPQADAARGGTISHAETARLADEMSRLSDYTAKDLLKHNQGEPLNHVRLTVARDLVTSSATALHGLATAIQEAGIDVTNAQRLEFVRRVELHAKMNAVLAGIKAEVGRSLSAMRIQSRAKANQVREINHLIQDLGGESAIDKIARAIAELDNAEAITAAAKKTTEKGFRQMAAEYYIMALVSGVPTHARNVLGNTFNGVAWLAEDAAGAGARVLRGGDGITMRQVAAEWHGLSTGFGGAWSAALHTLKTGESGSGISSMDAHPDAIPGKVGEVVRLPGRFLAAEDEFFKVLFHRMSIHGQAVEIALAAKHLAPEETTEHINRLTDEPTPEMFDEAVKEAHYRALQQRSGKLMRGLTEFKSDWPELNYILPFIKTPGNLAKYALERTPMAYVGSKIGMADAIKAEFDAGGVRADRAAGKVIVGTTLMAMALIAATQGALTGGGPSDQEARKTLEATGWRPYSFVFSKHITPNGKTWYVPFNQATGSFGMLAGIAADVVDGHHSRKQGAVDALINGILMTVSGNISNQTFLRGVSDFTLAMGDPDRYLQNMVSNIVGAHVPSFVANIAGAVDPTLRDTKGNNYFDSSLNKVESRLPFVSKGLPEQTDLLGRPRTRDLPGLLVPFSPVSISTGRDDHLVSELARLGENGSNVSSKLEHNGWSIDLTQDQRRELGVLRGQMLDKLLRPVVERPGWTALSEERQKATVDKVRARATAAAKAKFMREHVEAIRAALKAKRK